MRLNSLGIVTIACGLSLCRAQGVITTVAGTGTCCADADGGPALAAHLQGADGLVIDASGNFYIWEDQLGRVRKVNTAGIITTVAGVGGSFGFSGDGGPATSALLMGGTTHSGLALDKAGNLYISDTNNNRIRKINSSSGIISTVAGNGSQSFSGDNGPAINAALSFPEGIAVDDAGNLYIADASNDRVRKVSTTGIITTVAGNGNAVYTGDGVAATSAAIGTPEGVTVDSAGNLYIAAGRRIFKVNTAGTLTLIAGNGTAGSSGDGGPAVNAQLKAALGMAADSGGNLYFADSSNQRIRKVDAAGILTTLAGSTLGFSGDGGPATAALLSVPHDVALDPSGNLIFTDTGNFRVRRIAASGPSISVAPTPISFSYTVGGAAPAVQPVTVSSSGAGLSFSAAASTTSGGTWLSVTPGSGTTPATLNISVSPSGLPAGLYSGAITLTPSGAASQSFSVSLTVSGAGSPVFTSAGVVNATGYQNVLAPDTVFVIFGSGMGPTTIATAAAPNYPTSLAGTSITFTPAAGGASISASMVYSLAGQVAGLLPSSITPGTYAVRVTYNTLTSAPQNVTVAARSFGIATSNGAGNGPAQATVGNVNGGLSLVRYTTSAFDYLGYHWISTPAHPNDTIVLWGTGGGADAANDTGGSSGDQTAAGNFTVTIGTRTLTPSYAGSSPGFPGLWQINVQLPADIALDCFAPVQVSAGGIAWNTASIAIADIGQDACSDPQYQSLLSKLDAGGNIIFGAFGLARIGSSPTGSFQESASGFFGRYTATEFALPNIGPKFGGCVVYDRTFPANGKDPSSPDAFLDAGAQLPLSGPNIASALAANNSSALGTSYSLTLASGTLAGGNYTMAGSGGSQIGAFTSTTSFPADFEVPAWDSITSIDRSQPLTLTWTGTGVNQVYLQVSSTTVLGSNRRIVTLNCTVPGAPGTYTIPAQALAYLAAVPASGAAGFGSIAVEANNQGVFTAPLVGGGQIDLGIFAADRGFSKSVALQ